MSFEEALEQEIEGQMRDYALRRWQMNNNVLIADVGKRPTHGELEREVEHVRAMFDGYRRAAK